jgi:predicted phage tail protein
MSAKQLQLIRITNPFDPRERVHETLEWQVEKALADYFPSNVFAEEVVISHNGRIVPATELALTVPSAGDSVVLCPIPRGGDSKNIFRMVALIAVAVVAPYAAGFMMTGSWAVASGFGGMMLTAGLTMAGSMLVNSMLPVQTANVEGAQDMGTSPTYGIDGAVNTSVEGVPVPVVYGTFRMAGNLIAAYVENIGDTQILYALYNAGEGPIAGVSDVQLNDQPITNFSDVEVQTRLGTVDQAMIPWFNNTTNGHNVNRKLLTDWTEYRTSDVVDKLRLDFVCPAGLFGIDQESGNTHSSSVNVEAEYRKIGDLGWTPIGSAFVDHYNESITWLQYLNLQNELVTYVPDGTEWRYGDTYYINLPYDEFGPRQQVVGTVTRTPVYVTGLQITDNKRSTVRRSLTTELLPEGVYDVRVRRTTAESASTLIVDQAFLGTVNEIVVDDVRYIHSALVGVKIKLNDQLNGIPNVTYLNHGRVVKVWNALTKTWAFTANTNPAWAVLDAITNKRYGGGLAEARVDLESLKTFAAHCNENNLTFNGVFDQSMNMWDALQVILRVGRAQIVNVGTRYSFIIERAADPVMMFSVANMVKDSFKESWLPVTERANEIEVTYFDKNDGYKQKTIRVYDPNAVSAGRPPRSASITLFGIDNPDQAYREGLLQLNLNRYILQTVEFRAPIEAIACTVGDLIYVQHDMPQWGYAGRVGAGATTTFVPIDRTVPMETGQEYKLLLHYDSVQRASGNVLSVTGTGLTLSGFDGDTRVKRIQVASKDLAVLSVFDAGGGNYGVVVEDATGITPGAAYTLYDTDVLVERDVVNGGSSTAGLNLQSALPAAPVQFTHWMFGAVNKVKKPFRVKAINGTHEYHRDITALEYNASVYDVNGLAAPTPNYSSLPLATEHAIIEEVTEELVYVGSVIRTKATVNFYSLSENYRKSRVLVSVNGGPFEEVGYFMDRASVETDDGAQLVFKVIAMSLGGVLAPETSAPTISHTVLGKTAPPAAVSNFSITRRTTDLLLEWDPNPEIDVIGYEIRLGASWDDYDRILVQEFAGTMHVDDQSEAGTYVYHIRAWDGKRYGPVVSYTLVLNPPTAVKNFVAVQTGGRIDFQWDPHTDPTVVTYELREGVSWANGVKITEVDSNRFTIPAGSTATRMFWIVAIAAPGIYGNVPVFTSTDVANVPDRNTVYTDDQGVAMFPNTRHFADIVSNDVQMQSGVARSEYLFDVDLTDSFHAQNSIFAGVQSIIDDNLTWETANFVWSSVDAERPWTVLGNLADVGYRLQIAREVGLQVDETDGWRLNGTPNSVDGVTPSTAVGLSYAPGRYGDGVVLGNFATLDWALAVPSQFKHFMWVIPQEVDNVVYLTLSGAGIWLTLGYSTAGNKFYLEDHLSRRVELPMALAVGDKVLVGIVQTATERKLMAGKLVGNGSSGASASAAYGPIGAFTTVRLY